MLSIANDTLNKIIDPSANKKSNTLATKPGWNDDENNAKKFQNSFIIDLLM